MAAVAGIGAVFQGLSMIMQGAAAAAGEEHKAQQAKRAAEIGRLQADQIDKAYRDELSTTVSNIRAIRASTGANPDSPSSLAYIGEQAAASDRTRRIRAGAARMQATQYDLDAAFFKRSASSAMLGGFIGGLSSFAGAFG